MLKAAGQSHNDNDNDTLFNVGFTLSLIASL